ncbi:7392_t:CDS:1, partial [Rhizophagus irregularis]
YLALNFYVEESLGNCELTEFWVEARHDPNNRYLANKTNSINQNIRSTTATL